MGPISDIDIFVLKILILWYINKNNCIGYSLFTNKYNLIKVYVWVICLQEELDVH